MDRNCIRTTAQDLSDRTLPAPRCKRRLAAFLLWGWALASMLLLYGGLTGAQQAAWGQVPPPAQINQRMPDVGTDMGTYNSNVMSEEKQLRRLNEARQKALVADTLKLLKLANELNAEIAAANTGSFTPIQLRKLTEIEKLAHSVKEKMATSVRPNPAFQQFPAPQYP